MRRTRPSRKRVLVKYIGKGEESARLADQHGAVFECVDRGNHYEMTGDCGRMVGIWFDKKNGVIVTKADYSPYMRRLGV